MAGRNVAMHKIRLSPPLGPERPEQDPDEQNQKGYQPPGPYGIGGSGPIHKKFLLNTHREQSNVFHR